ncbi:ferrochelatase [Psychromonas antarctica]|jgi:ferrochelatase|uniref:ferrochelatase n=1 Tax=Psychromonas antarctica TaxID=67573 RepID=UPI001EE94F3B|nr:ferrochelatase [Psychromonas antarctica]MCG6202362.1 ferrochelatase [Psychromonas antarctica]
MNKKHAVLLVNLGTPESPDTKSVRSFLLDFLSDRRVVDIARIIWLPILYLIILPTRSARVAKLYKKIWFENDSPLRFYTKLQTQKLADRLVSQNITVEYAMTYGKPSIAQQIQKLQLQGITNLTVLPLYPQYSVSTTAPVFDQLSAAIKKQFNFPAINFIHDYHDHPLYIRALVESIRSHWLVHGKGQCLVFSFHGIPKRYVTLGDVYQMHCEQTVQLVVTELGLTDLQYKLCYQSRVGREEWLKPYLDETLPKIATQGIEMIDVISPAFSCDCLETLEELAMDNKALFLASGGKQFHYIPCLNDSDAHIALLQALVTK